MKKFLLILTLVLSTFSLMACGTKKNNDPAIKAYTRDTTSGTRDGFFTTIGFDEAVKDNTVLVAGHVQASGNGDMISYLKNDEYGIGYISLSSLANSTLKGLKYNDVEPNEVNVLSGDYKLTRNFNYAVRNEFATDAERKIVTAFVAYLSTKEGKATIKANDGIVLINDNDLSWDDIKAQHPITLEDNSGITIKFGGSTSVEKIAKALSAEFKLKCGNFDVEHNHTGSGDAYKRTQGSEKDAANKLHIAFASREFKDTEALADGTYGKICTDAIVAVVNTKNSLTNVTNETLKGIYDGSITKWKELK